MKVSVITFPGSNCDLDTVRFFRGFDGVSVEQAFWHSCDLSKTDLAILPGGFSYGDYLRAGAIAARLQALDEVKRFASRGGWVLGICNGFQILTESGLLPGALALNDFGYFLCRVVKVKAAKSRSPFMTGVAGKTFQFPVANGEGRYVADADLLKRLAGEGQIAWTWEGFENGSAAGIAGICDSSGRVMGLMPHPERNEEDGRAWVATWLGKVGVA